MCDFADENFLKLNVLKCEVMVFGSGNGNVDSPNCVVGDGALPVRDTVKCLGYWWSKDLVALKCVDENIRPLQINFLFPIHRPHPVLVTAPTSIIVLFTTSKHAQQALIG